VHGPRVMMSVCDLTIYSTFVTILTHPTIFHGSSII
jgi:hypothetical protein